MRIWGFSGTVVDFSSKVSTIGFSRLKHENCFHHAESTFTKTSFLIALADLSLRTYSLLVDNEAFFVFESVLLVKTSKKNMFHEEEKK